ncbi:MAG: nickel pincer cofactor biosynthesis protein LarC [Promethearchaeota archaeon]
MIINCGHSGISGDLLISALAEIISREKMQEFINLITENMNNLHPPKFFLQNKTSFGIEGCHLDVEQGILPTEAHIKFSPESVTIISPDESESAKYSQHTSVLAKHIKKPSLNPQKLKELLINLSQLAQFSSQAQNYVQVCFDLLMKAESKVHNIPLSDVHLHEIGAIDTVVDLLSVAYGLDQLGAFQDPPLIKIYSQAIAVGRGTVKIAHGNVPVPAPATLEILKKSQLKFIYGPENKELATPTGVALLAGLKMAENLTQELPTDNIIIQNTGIGVGNLQLKNRANILQILLAKAIQSTQSTQFTSSNENSIIDHSQSFGELKHRKIFILESNVDDVRGEILGRSIPILMNEGALDVSIIPTITKKNRPGHLIKVICKEAQVNPLIKLLMKNTGTLGVRILEANRVCLVRKIINYPIEIEGESITITIKVSIEDSNQILNYKLEYDDLAELSEKWNIPFLKLEKMVQSQISLTKIQEIFDSME